MSVAGAGESGIKFSSSRLEDLLSISHSPCGLIKALRHKIMCSALLLPKSAYQMIHVFSAFFSTHHTEICFLAATSYSKSENSWSCGVCFPKQSQKLAMVSRAQICCIHTSGARYKRPSAFVPSSPSLPTTSFILFTKKKNSCTDGRLCASQITRRLVHVLSSSLVAKYTEAKMMESQDQFRKTKTGSS